MPLLPAPKEMHTVPGVSPARGFTATNAGPFAEERLASGAWAPCPCRPDGLYYAVIAVQADATLPDLPAVLRPARPGRGLFPLGGRRSGLRAVGPPPGRSLRPARL